ncbi:Nuclear pore complex protein Nup160 homolog [Eumeta japonica]|uniref:Nuclear pore complex protein Nup160 homolog n=1 Tax=Eumeta variegata TaxID=151549 RepID=A0A4C1U0P3_EUMVA|nr:Nuclear pore complex protein Nup160 homolog [Eumeta japonica]
MDFTDAIPIAFKEITPNCSISEKWREVVLNTGGTHTTLQDIKLPQKAGGYWYRDANKVNTRNRFIYWQTTSDSIELSEASLDVNLIGSNLRCKVAPGTPPLNGTTIWERTTAKEVVVLVATVSSVHRLIFPHPEVLEKKATFNSTAGSSLSVFHEASSINNPHNYYILTQHSNSTTGVAHTCASLLRENGEAVFVLAFGPCGDGGVMVIKLPISGTPVTLMLKRESAVPRFLSGITGALRGKAGEGLEALGLVLNGSWAVALCGDACLRTWLVDVGGTPVAVSQPLSQNTTKPKPPPQGHMLQKTIGEDGNTVLVAVLSFPHECEFVVIKMQDNGGGAVKFANICRLFGPQAQLDLLDYTVGYADGGNIVWALWSQPDGNTIITTSTLGPEVEWRAVAPHEPVTPLPQLSSHQQYRDRLLAPGLFPASVIRKALVIYRRTWGGGEMASSDADLAEATMSAVAARLRHIAARSTSKDQAHLMHKCWSDLYSWCMQYMEGLQKPLGLIVYKNSGDTESEGGWWCAVVRRAGMSLIRELEPLERMLLASDTDLFASNFNESVGELSSEAVRVVAAGARWERAVGPLSAADLERRLFACAAPQHRLLPRLMHLLMTPSDDRTPIMTPQQIDELTSLLDPIKDLQSAVLELNDALKLDVPEIDISKGDNLEAEYNTLFSSELGVSIITEAIRQMAEMRSRVVRGAVAALGAARGADGVPGAGHCMVHWQAYRALLWLRHHAALPLQTQSSSDELFRLKLSSLGMEGSGVIGNTVAVEGVVHAYAAGAGGRRARAHLAAARAPSSWHQALPHMSYHLAYQLWAVTGVFEFGWWLATINQPQLVKSYVTLLEPWCEWNACSQKSSGGSAVKSAFESGGTAKTSAFDPERQFILGLALLDLEDPEGAYTAFRKAAKGVSTEPFLRQLVAAAVPPTSQHQALVLYYMKVIKLFEIHDAGACVVRLAETAISIAEKDDPNLSMFQWLVFKWHLAGGRIERALSAAAANRAPHARATAAAKLLTTLASRGQLEALVSCGALAEEAERTAIARARLHDPHAHNPYYNFLYALYISRHHYRKAYQCKITTDRGCVKWITGRQRADRPRVRRRLPSSSHSYCAVPRTLICTYASIIAKDITAEVMYERATHCAAEGAGGPWRRRWLPRRSPAQARETRTCFFSRRNDKGVQPGVNRSLALTSWRELREEDPESLSPIQKALSGSNDIDFNNLYNQLMEADPETLQAITKRVISTGQFLPHWFLQRYMEVDSGACVRALLAGGRAVEAGAACATSLRAAICSRLTVPVAPTCTVALPTVDLVCVELMNYLHDEQCKQVYEELNEEIKQYMQVVVRTSEDMKLAKIKFPVVM